MQAENWYTVSIRKSKEEIKPLKFENKKKLVVLLNWINIVRNFKSNNYY